MELKQFKTDEMIFRQGDPSDCMYRIREGKVGIFVDYGEAGHTKITELSAGQFLGEMGLLDKVPRSATAISLCEDTVLQVINEENFTRSFTADPEDLLFLLQQMSTRLRRISRDYTEVCRTVSEVVETEKTGAERSPALKNRIAKTLAGFEVSRTDEKTGEEGDA